MLIIFSQRQNPTRVPVVGVPVLYMVIDRLKWGGVQGGDWGGVGGSRVYRY